MKVFSKQVIVITGASEGIGRALATALAPSNPKLVLAARNEARLVELAESCRARGAECFVCPTDVTKVEDCRGLIEATVSEFQGIDCFINNAGMTMWGYFDDLEDPDLAAKVLQLNLQSCIYCTHYALPHLKKSKGRLVGTSSIAGVIGVPGHTIYGASKHALHGFFDSLRVELMGTGVSVTIVCPDFVQTEIHYRGLDSKGHLMKKRLASNVGISAEECARRILPAVARRQRLVMTSTRGKLAVFARNLVPQLIDLIAHRSAKKHNLL